MNWSTKMGNTYWHRQTNTPLFPELEWARPENKRHAGKLLIIGGNLHGFSAPASAYTEAEKAGIGTARVLLPNAIQKTVGSFMPQAEFAPSTPSGSFAAASLDTWLEHAAWADTVLLAGDLGRNSETAIVLEKFLGKTTTPVAITKDALDYCLETRLLERPDILIVANMGQLQKLATAIETTTPITSGMDLLHLVDALHAITASVSSHITTMHQDNALVASGGQVSTTKVAGGSDVWQVRTAAHAAVWWLQHPQKPFEAITTSLIS